MIKKEFLKFIIVGIINTIFYYLLYIFFIFIGFKYYFAVVFATLIGIFFSFKTISKLVFKQDDNRLLLRFLIVYSVNIIFNILIIKFLTIYSFNLYSAGFIATIIVALSSFFLNKFYVFKVNNE